MTEAISPRCFPQTPYDKSSETLNISVGIFLNMVVKSVKRSKAYLEFSQIYLWWKSLAKIVNDC